MPGCNICFVTDGASPVDIDLLKSVTVQDPSMNLLKEVFYKEWPSYGKKHLQELWNYWNFGGDLVLEDALVLKSDRIVIPELLQEQVLQTIHTGHQGETRFILLAKKAVFWPDIVNDIHQIVEDCELCNRHQPAQQKLLIMQLDLSCRPWKNIDINTFNINGQKYHLDSKDDYSDV